MTRIVHTADTHVGYRQYHSSERREDFLRAFESVIDDAVADDADAVVHAGDLFHDRRPGLVDIQGVIDALRRLDDAGVPFLAVVGNHETKRDAQWLDLFENLGLATRLGREPVVVGDVALYGQDFVPRARRAALDYDFQPADPGAGDAGRPEFAALVGHGAYEPFVHANWDTEALLDASSVDFDALLLGDVHHPGREEVADVLATYPGSTERASAEEREERGYNIVAFQPDGDVPVSVTRRSVADAREFVFVDLHLETDQGEPRVREAVRQQDLADAVLIVTVEGTGEPVTPASIEELALEQGAAIARVNDRRELESEAAAADVSFADPDLAVDRRLSERGLSEAAHGVDDLVRTADDVARSHVREATKRRVRERLEDDPGSLRAVAEDSDSTESDTGAATAAESDDGPGDADGVTTAGSDDVTERAAGTDGDATAPVEASDDPDTASDDPDAATRTTAAERDESDDGTADEEGAPAEDGEPTAPADQASMEEYL